MSSSQELKAPRGWLLVVDDDSSVRAVLVDLLGLAASRARQHTMSGRLRCFHRT
jgi:hypothetical protein